MKSSKINLILMKNGGQTHRWNTTSTFLYLLIGTLILIPIFFILSIILNINLYKEYNKAAQNQIELQYIVDRNAQTIVRLNNLESFLRDYSPDLLGLLVTQANLETGTVPTVEGVNEALAKELNTLTRVKDSDAKAEVKITGNNQNNVQKNTLVPAEKTPVATVQTEIVTVPEVLNEKITTQEVVAKTASTKNTSAENIKQHIDLSYVALKDVQIKLVANKLNIQYSLYNNGKTVPLAGRQEYTLINVKNGKITRTALPNITDDQFRIRNLKLVKGATALSGIEIGKMARIQIDIIADDTILFRETYPISR